MGILKRKVTDPTPIEPTRFSKMSDEEVYMAFETALMETQYALSEYRKTSRDGDMRAGILKWLDTGLITARTACQELISRNT
jgi:hypothetical protein